MRTEQEYIDFGTKCRIWNVVYHHSSRFGRVCTKELTSILFDITTSISVDVTHVDINLTTFVESVGRRRRYILPRVHETMVSFRFHLSSQLHGNGDPRGGAKKFEAAGQFLLENNFRQSKTGITEKIARFFPPRFAQRFTSLRFTGFGLPHTCTEYQYHPAAL